MLELLQSNRMSLLIETLCERLQQPDNPFEPVSVVVQSQGIGQWLKVELAKRLGVAANIDCLLPAELIWRLYQKVLPDALGTELPDDSPFSRTLLTWRLMQLLPESEEPTIQQYLKPGDDLQLRLYQLSHAIALLYDQYLIYRPSWIYAWEAGEADAELQWQSDLWRQLIAQSGMDARFHRANLHRTFISAVTSSRDNLPGQLNVLGISSLPAMHLETLQAIAQHQQVSVYFLNPSEQYWGDIESEKLLAKKSVRDIINKEGPLLDEDYLEVGNPLLSSTGKQGREFLELLLQAEGVQSVDLFQPIQGSTALDLIHRDILNLEFGGEFYDVDNAPTQQVWKATDKSIQIHCTHSRMREVEVLLDQILGMIDRSNGNITPSDIIVMAPDVSMYAPYIQAVFQDKIAFSITDRPALDQSAILVAFKKLLSLPDSRLTATEVMDLLEVPAIANRFELGEAELSRLQFWVREAGVRYEFDGKHKQEKWQLPDDDYNTWRFGLDRLLLGLAMDPDAGLFAETAPFAVDPQDAELLGTLCDFVDLLAHHREILAAEHVAADWQGAINQLMQDLIVPTSEDELILTQVNDALANLVNQNSQTQFTEAISSRLFRYWLLEQLEQPPQNRGFVSGGITFATLVPMRSIPYPCVCLIGMNDKEFPREDKPLSFDLMANNYQKGDRSRRNDDRYLFLEALLSAQETFYLSYIGRGQRDNKEKPPSELLSELQDYLNRIYGKFPQQVHPLQPFNSVYFETDSPLRSYASHWYQALSEQVTPKEFSAEALPEAVTPLTKVSQLTQFYRNPAKYFLTQQLGVYLREDDEILKDTESFELDGLERYQIADAALQNFIAGNPIEDWMAQIQASGAVLPGLMGTQQLNREVKIAQEIYERLRETTAAHAQTIQIEIEVAGIFLTAALPLHDDQYIVPRTGSLHARQQLDAWINHLALCAGGYQGESLQIYRSGSGDKRKVATKLIHAVTQEQAQGYLKTLIEYYYRGLREPLFFLPEASLKYVQTSSLDDASKLFGPEVDRPGQEASDEYIRRIWELPEDFNDEFCEIAEAIWTPLLSGKEAI